MTGELRVLVQAQQAFFVVEVKLRVLNQPVQYLRQNASALTRAHRLVQLTADGEQHLMLGVDAPDIYGVLVLPLKHVPHIGGTRHKL
jgi:hypothetical protein